MARSALLFVFAMLVSGTMVSATSFNVVNRCGNSINVVVRENPGGPSIGTSGFTLGASGGSSSLTPPNGWSGNIGSGTPGLLAEFAINSNGQDFYDLSAVDGFFLGVGMSVTGSGESAFCSADPGICPAENVMGNACVNPNRDDGNTQYAQNVRASCRRTYIWSGDDANTLPTGTGGTFTITFCP